MEITYRFAQQKDLSQIREILNHAIAHTTAVYDYDLRSENDMQNWWKTKRESNHPILVATENNTVVGFCSYGEFRRWQGFYQSMEHSVYVHEQHQGKGIGKTLLAELLNEAKRRNVHVLIGGIDADNEASIRLHEKLGFSKTGHLREVGFKFDRYLDLVFMQIIL